jgi:hypothetical protein
MRPHVFIKGGEIMFANIASEAGWNLIVLAGVFAFGLWGFRRLFGQFDSKGEIKGAAKDGIIRMLTRWLK